MDETLETPEDSAVVRRKLARDMRALAHDAEELVKATAGTVADKTREELHLALDRLKASCRNIEEHAVDRAEAADALIRQHPYQSIGLAFGLGLIVGVILNR